MSEVSEFLLRVRELGEKTDREDELRAKQLEEEIAEGRRRRQALRAERARSLSPEKRMDSTPMRRPEVDELSVTKPINLNSSPAPRISPRLVEKSKDTVDRSEMEKRKEERISQLRELRMRESEKRAAEEEEQKERELALEKQRHVEKVDDSPKRQDVKTVAESPLADEKLTRAEEIKRQIASIVGPSGTLPVFPGEKPTTVQSTPPVKPVAKRVASGPKPQVAPKPSTLTSPLSKENKSPTVTEKTSTTNFAALNRARLGHAKANSVSFIEGTPKLDSNNTPPAGSFLASRSPTRHESPTRGGFIRSAMLKRENTVRSSSPANSSFSREILFSSSPESHNERSPPAPIRTATLHAAPIVSRSSPSDKIDKPIKPVRPLSMAAPSSTSLASSPPLPRDNSSHSSLSDFSISPIVQRRAENSQYINSTPSALWRSNTVRADNNTMPTSDSIESISSIASSSISREGTPSRARSLTPAHSSPAANLSTGTVDSRRWSPVRQQPSWLESALKKNGPPTPGQEQGLVRAGTIARTPSRSPVKNGHNRTMSFDRPPLSSPLDLARESPMLRREDSITREPAKPTPPPKSSNLSGVYSANSSFNSSFTRTTSARQADKSLDNSIEEENVAPAILRKNSLRPPPPKPSVASKTSPEAIERLRSLRHQTMNRFEARDEAKETLERLKSGLRRSNTVQYKAPDELKDSVLAAKSSLKMNTSIKEEDEEVASEAPILPTQPKKQMSFQDSLSSALAQGPPPSAGAQPRRAHTFDSSFDTKDEGLQRQNTQLTHMTKRRAKGPKRRLPTAVKGASVSTPNLASQLSHQDSEDKFKLRTVQLSANPVTPSGKLVPASLIPGGSPAHSPERKDDSTPTTPLSVVKNRNNAGRARPAVRSSSRTVSAKLGNNGTSPTRSPPKPRTPSSQVRIKTQI